MEPEIIDLNEDSLQVALSEIIANKESLTWVKTPMDIVLGVVNDDWGLELTVEGDFGHGDEQFSGNEALAQDIIAALKKAGHL